MNFIMNVNLFCVFVKTEICTLERHASNYYNGITVGIDFTARDIQDECRKKGLPWEKAKAFDNSLQLENSLILLRGFNPKTVNFSLNKNAEQVQKGNWEV